MALTVIKRSRTDVEIGPTRDKMVLTILKMVLTMVEMAITKGINKPY